MAKNELAKALETLRNPAPGVSLVSHGWVKSRCDWTRDKDGSDHTDCGKVFVFDDGSNPGENGFVWCPYCRKEIKAVQP